MTKTTDLTVVLHDENKKPIADAEVMVYGVRTQDGGWRLWDREVYGPVRTVISDKDGKAVVKYPSHVRPTTQIMTTRQVTFRVMHSWFVTQDVHFDLGPPRANITLRSGCDVELSAVDANHRPIKRFGVHMAGPSATALWADTDTGGRRTGAIMEGTWKTLLVKLQEDGPTLFSNVLRLRVRKRQKVHVRDIMLEPGAVVRGRLSDNVPRPVKGYVVAASFPSPAENPSVRWLDWTDVEADGTFVFESLPRSGDLQLIAFCDGWLSETHVDESLAHRRVMGQVFEISKPEHSIVVDMEPTGTLELSLVKTDGKPFAEGRVSSWPNQRYLNGGSTLLGKRLRSSSWIKEQFLPAHQRGSYLNWRDPYPYNRRVKADGTVTLTGLPIGYNERVALFHDSYELKADEGEDRFVLPSPEPVSRTMLVIPVK